MLNRLYKTLRQNLEKGVVRKNYDLYPHNSYKVHSVAKVAVIVNSLETFCKTMSFCEQFGIKPIVIGNGTNIILARPIIDGVVIIFGNKFSNIYMQGNNVIADSGASILDVINFAKDNNLTGMEQAIGIPGTIGGAVYMNAQAFDFSIDRVVGSVLIYIDGKIRLWNKDECGFGYRKSIFQDGGGIILRVELCLKQSDRETISNNILKTLEIRRSKQGVGYPNAGSVFKNGNNYFAGELIDKCGLKNYNINNAYVSDKHANFIVNKGSATGEDIISLIGVIKAQVKREYGVDLELEQRIIGDK